MPQALAPYVAAAVAIVTAPMIVPPPSQGDADPRLVAALRAAAPNLRTADAAMWARVLADPMRAADITTPRRIAGFAGQCAVESDGFTTTAENLRYSHAARICAVWPSRFPTEAAAAAYVNAPEALANSVYANRMGNGPPDSGDGWRFRGLGLIQITGREEYAAFAASIGRPIDAAAAWAATPEGAAASATWFWSWKALNRAADAWDLMTLTRRINGGLIGLADRQRACTAAFAVLEGH
jgi:putative chitinase